MKTRIRRRVSFGASHRRRRPRDIVTSLALVVALLASGCGSDDEPTPSADEPVMTDPGVEMDLATYPPGAVDSCTEVQSIGVDGGDVEDTDYTNAGYLAAKDLCDLYGNADLEVTPCAGGFPQVVKTDTVLIEASETGAQDATELTEILVQAGAEAGVSVRVVGEPGLGLFTLDVMAPIQINQTSSAGSDTVGDVVTFLNAVFDGEDLPMRAHANHVYSVHPVWRGHPIDGYEPQPDVTPMPTPATDSATIRIVDLGGGTAPGSTIDGHGAFIQRIVAATASELAPVEAVKIDAEDGTLAALTEADIVAAVRLAVPPDQEADKVVNMSFGTYTCGQAPTALTIEIQRLVQGGASVVASAGNNEFDQPVWPAALSANIAGLTTLDGSPVTGLHDDVYSVGSSSAAEPDVRSCFSNYGNWVETWYPGERVQATVGEAGRWSGTSFAAPQAIEDLQAGQNMPDKTSMMKPPYTYEVIVDGVKVRTFCDEDSGYQPS